MHDVSKNKSCEGFIVSLSRDKSNRNTKFRDIEIEKY